MTANMCNDTVRLLLKQLGSTSGAFTIHGDELNYKNSAEALFVLQRQSLDLMAYTACTIDKSLKDKLADTFWEESVFQVGLLAELSRIQQIFRQEQVRAILLKGFSLKRYYPKDCLRPMSDIDFLIAEENIHDCLSALENLGYAYVHPETVDVLLSHYGEIELFHPVRKIKVELHWDFISSKSIRKATTYDPDFVFGSTEPFEIEDVSLQVLPPHLELAYLMAHHVLHHQFQRALWLLDIMLVLKITRINWSEFEKAVVRLGITRPVYYYIGALLKILGPTEFKHDDLGGLKNRLAPRQLRYYLFATFKKPKSILKKGGRLRKFNDLMFRNAFK